MDELDIYDLPTSREYAAVPAVNNTLAVLFGADTNSVEQVAQQTATMGPAYVAAERARLVRQDNMLLLKNATLELAKQNNAPAVEKALQEIQAAETPVQTPSFFDDVKDSAEEVIERVSISMGKSKEEVISLAKLYSANTATRAALEVVSSGLEQRGVFGQLAMGLTGAQSAADLGRLTPVLNRELEKLGYTGERAFSFQSGVNAFLDTLRSIPAEDRGKVILNISEVLKPVVGEKNTRRFFDAAQQGFADSTVDAIFSSMDALMLGSLLRAGAKVAVNASRGVAMARKLGAEKAAVDGVASQIANGSNNLGVTTVEAVDAAITARTLLSKELDGVSSAVQTELRARLEKTIADLENTLYSGGANAAEVIATKERLERIYTTENNAAIITSKVDANAATGKITIDVTYGNNAGLPFNTPEEALAYYKNIKRGDLEVVPVAGKPEDVKAAILEMDSRIAGLTNELNELKFAPRMGASGTVDDVKKAFPLLNEQVKGVAGPTSAQLVMPSQTVKVSDAWQTVRATASGPEKFVVDKIVDLLPKETRVLVREGDGVSFYSPGTDVVVLYNGNRSSNVFTHEIVHAVTTHKIKYGKLNPSSELGKITTRLENLRAAVVKELPRVKDPELKNYLNYLTKNTEEFATSGLWSINQLPKVAIFLDSIKYKNTTLLSQLWSTFKDLLGFGRKDTALSEWFGLNEEYTKQGLRVNLTKQIETPTGGTVSMLDTARVFPAYLPNKKVDNILQQYEDVVADRIAMDADIAASPAGYYVRQRADMPVFVDDIGKISQSELDKIHLNLGKLNPRLASVNSIYGPALTSMLKRTRYGKVQSDFIKASFDKLNASEIDKVNAALKQTEALKRDMTLAELGEKGITAEKEIEAYYAFRTMRNVEYYLKNKEAANALISKGYSNVRVSMGDEGVFTGPAKPLKLDEVKNRKVFDVENNRYVTVTDDVLKEFDAKGIQIFEYAKAQNLRNHKGAITRVAVPPNRATVGDINTVVGRVDGAYSRVYTEEYFIKINGKQLVDDDLKDTSYAFRTAVSEKDASAYVAGFNKLIDIRKSGVIVRAEDVSKQLGNFEKNVDELAERINAGEFDNTKATFNYSRVDDNFFRDVTGIGSDNVADGRVFWSGRSEQGIKSISTGSTDLETLGPLQSLEAEISNTARFTALNEWRRNAIQRWYNTFEDVISSRDKLDARSAEDVFFNVVNNAKGYALSDARPRQMLVTKDFIITQLGVKSVDEKVIQHAVNNLTNNINVPGFSHVGQVIRRTDVIDWVKGVNSTLMLGLFSAAQLAVQASGMLLATSMSPKHGLAAAFSIRPILIAMTSDKPSVWKWVFKNTGVGKKGGITESEFGEVAEAIKRVGLLDNIGASSVYNAADGALNIFAKRRAKFNQAQMMFFNKGEEINRVGAFEIARREFIEANPGVKWNTDDALQKIVLRADDLTLNMSSVNEARISQGIVGIPLQFLQHNIRLGTTLLAQTSAVVGKQAPSLSTKDAFRLTLGSYLLYGVNNNATPDFVEDWLGDKYNSTLSEAQKQYLTQGLLAGLISTIGETVTGERTNIALGSRLSSIQWYEDLGDAVFSLFKGDKVDIKKLAGPTGSTLVSLLELPSIFLDYRHKDEWTLSDFTATLSAAGGTLASSWRNIDKAYWAYHADNMVLNKRGDPLAKLSWTELVAQAIGFQSTEAYESSTVFDTKKSYAAIMQNYADTIMRLEGLARKAYMNDDVAGMNDNYAAAEAVMAPLPEADRQFIKRLIQDKTSYDTVGREAFAKWATQMSSHKNRLLVTSPFGE